MIDRIKSAAGSMRFWMIVLGGALTAANAALKIVDDKTLIVLLALLGVGVGGDTLRPIGTPQSK
jgi:hypothetical protein